MIIYNNKTEVAKALGLKSRQAVNTAIDKKEVKQVSMKRGKKEFKGYVIVRETILYLLS